MMREFIEHRIAEHRQRIAAGQQLLRELDQQREMIARELLQREGAVAFGEELLAQEDRPADPEAA